MPATSIREPATLRARSATWVVVATTGASSSLPQPARSTSSNTKGSRRSIGAAHLTETDSRFHERYAVADGPDRLADARPARAHPLGPPRGRRARGGPRPARRPGVLPQRP